MSSLQPRRALVLSHFNIGINRVFEDYCRGIRANVDDYHYIDYIDAYLAKGKRWFERDIEQLVVERRITHVFFIWWSCDLTFDVSFLARLSQKARLVMNFFDTEYFFEDVDRYYAQVADIVMLPDELSRYRYDHLGIPCHTSFALFDSAAYRCHAGGPFEIDVSFVGNLKQSDRSEYIRYLKDHGIRVECFGIASDHGFVSFDDMVRIFNRSRIVLNFTGVSSFDNYAIPLPRINQRIKQSKGRPIEIALCGGFILSQYAPGIEKMFMPGEEFDYFRTKEEMLEKVKYYLDNDAQRAEMANRAHQRALASYDTVVGFRNLLERLDDTTHPQPETLYLDPAFRGNYAAFRFFYIVLFLLRGNFPRSISELISVIRARRINILAAYHFSTRGFLHFLREHPELEHFFKKVRRWLPMKLKY